MGASGAVTSDKWQVTSEKQILRFHGKPGQAAQNDHNRQDALRCLWAWLGGRIAEKQ
jgi:hypothetical protein